MKQIPAIISMVLLIGFLLPYIWKIKEIPLLILLIFGVFLAIYDFYVSNRKKTNLKAQHAPYDQEST